MASSPCASPSGHLSSSPSTKVGPRSAKRQRALLRQSAQSTSQQRRPRLSEGLSAKPQALPAGSSGPLLGSGHAAQPSHCPACIHPGPTPPPPRWAAVRRGKCRRRHHHAALVFEPAYRGPHLQRPVRRVQAEQGDKAGGDLLGWAQLGPASGGQLPGGWEPLSGFPQPWGRPALPLAVNRL